MRGFARGVGESGGRGGNDGRGVVSLFGVVHCEDELDWGNGKMAVALRMVSADWGSWMI